MEPRLEHITPSDEQSIRLLHIQCTRFQEDHDWHYHSECEIAFVASGYGTQLMGDSVTRFQPGDLLLIGANLPHCWRSSEQSLPCELLVLQFDPVYLDSALLSAPEARHLKPLLADAQRGLRYRGKAARDIGTQLHWVKQHTAGLSRFSALLQLLDRLGRMPDAEFLSSEVYALENRNGENSRLQKAIQFVKAHLSEEIKQTAVADLVCMTPQSFSRFFRAQTGRTFVSFVNAMRINEACKHLLNSDADIIDIAYACGYSNLSNFNRRFAEIEGCTPSEFRRKHAPTQQLAS